mgnify:CR=1 FL=1
MRGEHPGIRGPHVPSRGSSPRARGAPDRVIAAGDSTGIIPACAGSTCSTSAGNRSCGDHPRVRGEHSRERVATSCCRGSSPRARGARLRLHQARAVHGIIPACAGSTARPESSTPTGRDHPRVRGEHTGVEQHEFAHQGSSPRARGAQVGEPSGELGEGIIPACAGSTRHGPSPSRRARDHPRVRGEHSF